jgi:hypothetical protein
MRGADFEGVRKQMSQLSFKKKHDLVENKGVHPHFLWGLWPQFDTLWGYLLMNPAIFS